LDTYDFETDDREKLLFGARAIQNCDSAGRVMLTRSVMAGLVPGIHVLILGEHEEKGVDARHKAGHDR